MAHTWLQRYPSYPRPVARLAIGNVWSWSEVERWAAETGHGHWDQLPAGLVGDELVPLQAWAKEHDVLPADLIELGREGLLPLASRGRRWYLEPTMAAAVWAEHGSAWWPSTSWCREGGGGGRTGRTPVRYGAAMLGDISTPDAVERERRR